MIFIAVCDDMPIECIEISEMLHKIFLRNGIEHTIKQFFTGSELLKSECSFDIIFLDIRMKNLNGIETAQLLRKREKQFVLIFITSYDEYVYDAFDVEAFNYILKPIDISKLEEVSLKAIKKISNYEEKFIIINKNRQTIKVNLNDIIYFEAKGRIIEIHFNDKVIEYYEKLSILEHKLMNENFFRCHKSYLINLKHSGKFTKNEILMDNGDKVLISKRKYNIFSKTLLSYMKKEGGIL